MMTLTITLDLPDNLIQQLEDTAESQHRSIADVVRELLLQNWSSEPKLPDQVEAELAAMSNLSDEALWLLARSTIDETAQQTLTTLNQQAKQRNLTPKEEDDLNALLEQYDRAMVRRAQAASLLQQRGYDMSAPTVLQP